MKKPCRINDSLERHLAVVTSLTNVPNVKNEVIAKGLVLRGNFLVGNEASTFLIRKFS